MLNFLNSLFFHCRHNRCTFPITSKLAEQRSGTAAVTGTYYVCVDCGSEFAYDWHEMRVVNGHGRQAKTLGAGNRKPAARAS